jgi:hypothetical protein
MMKPKVFIVLALLLALMLSGELLAGPRRPQWGDPDIVEGIKTKGGVRQQQVRFSSPAPIVIDIPFLGRIVLARQDRRETQGKLIQRLPAASKGARIRR